ncbi:hypothetical protein N474_01095 [Pseudoalteromonas luteoviolacea CPMOR-2]|uniref:putative 2OG-Fe(II) oxygenase n=1 Tax=Pseudoalteromonas luteoviolacea TaxID=43657 RepID=UPI0007B0A148|nr:putative 2OG-Fe(II) oxygenase [Pseudoalteromonas luteoviolacea]KZN55560.1 hypothetical protein N474_01095 [Pseudoalteromonas luteoviolacea CPMOR-2]
MELRTEEINLWPTRIITVEADQDITKGLAKIIMNKEKEILEGQAIEVAGNSKGITAHWLEYNVLNWDYPECRELRRRVLKGFKEYCKSVGEDYRSPEFRISGISCWANILRNGEGLLIHHHDPAWISAHFQVQCNQNPDKPEGSGETVYYRPGFIDRSHGDRQAGSVSLWDEDWKINKDPKPGRLAFFPSYLRHEVRPYIGEIARISIALDVYVAKQKALINFAAERWWVPDMEELEKA